MSWQYNPYAIPLFIGVVPLIVSCIVALRRSDEEMARLFALFALMSAGGMLTYGIELLAADLRTILFVLKFEYIFLVPIPVTWLMFVLAYTGFGRWLTPGRIALLFLIPAAHIVLSWTNAWHHLNWATIGVMEVNGLAFFDRTAGIGGQIGAYYLYACVAVAAFLLFGAVIRSPEQYRGQIVPLLIGMILPWIGNALHLFNLTPFPYLDLTPYGLALTVPLIALSLFRFRLFELTPAAHYRVIRSLGDAVIVLDQQNRVVDLNPAGEHLINSTASDAVGQPAADILPPPLMACIGDSYSTNTECAVEEDGEVIHIDLRISPLEDRHGRPRGRVIVLRDISLRKRAEAQVRKLSRAVEQTASIVIITDTEGDIEYVNPAFTRVTGYTFDEAIGQNPRLLKGGETAAKVYEQLWDTITAGGMWQGEFHNKKKDGSFYWGYATISPIKDETGKITHFIGIQEDVTARKQAEETIQQVMEEIEQRNIELDTYSHTIAHDLRAPLGALIGFAHLIKDADRDDLLENSGLYADKVLELGYKMVGMIESLLLFVHLRNAEEVLTTVEMGPVVQAALARFQDLINERNVDITVMDGLPPALGHAPWLEEVFANLIGNAIKYVGKDNPDPRIIVRARRENGMIRYEVEDNGLGIAAEDINKLFEMFTRLHPKEGSGFGLGLSIVRRIITKLNGQFGVESTPGEGSTFWFTLPAPE
jgi:PAS domain S-box-containing protein